MNIAVLASGRGSNFEAIAKAVRNGYIKAKLKLLIVDKPKALARTRAKKFAVKDVFVDPKKHSSRRELDKAIIKVLKSEKIDLVVLAGYMRILSPYFVRSYKNKILNIHPSLLPRFRGKEAIERAFKSKAKLTGVSVHFVDNQVDHGPIILQAKIRIKKGMSLASLEKAIHQVEHKLYPKVIKLFIEGKLKIRGRSVKVS